MSLDDFRGRVVDYNAPVTGSLGAFVGGGLVGGVYRAIKNAQGAAVTFETIGNFLRATWTIPGKGAGYVRWQRYLDGSGRTVRLFKDVWNQSGRWIRRDWYRAWERP